MFEDITYYISKDRTWEYSPCTRQYWFALIQGQRVRLCAASKPLNTAKKVLESMKLQHNMRGTVCTTFKHGEMTILVPLGTEVQVGNCLYSAKY